MGTSGGLRHAMTGRTRPAIISRSRRPACSPVSYMSICG
jgi:hypothetical protein